MSSPRSAGNCLQQEDDIDEALLDQMLWKAECLASAMKRFVGQRDDRVILESVHVEDPYYTIVVPKSIDMNQPHGDALTECSSSVGGFRPPSHHVTLGNRDKGRQFDSGLTINLFIKDSGTDDESGTSGRRLSVSSSSMGIGRTATARSEAEIRTAIKTAREMKLQLDAVLDSSVECSSCKSDNHSADHGTVVSLALGSSGNSENDQSALVHCQLTKDDGTVPIADYTRLPTGPLKTSSNAGRVVLGEVGIVTEDDQDFAPICSSTSISPSCVRGISLREMASAKRAALIRKRRVMQKHRRRLAVMTLSFVAVVTLLLHGRSHDASTSIPPKVPHLLQERMKLQLNKTRFDAHGNTSGDSPTSSKAVKDIDDAFACLPATSTPPKAPRLLQQLMKLKLKKWTRLDAHRNTSGDSPTSSKAVEDIDDAFAFLPAPFL